jgi:hypothetical protein
VAQSDPYKRQFRDYCLSHDRWMCNEKRCLARWVKTSKRKARNAERSEVDAAVAQLAEQVPCKDTAGGSSPSRGSK